MAGLLAGGSVFGFDCLLNIGSTSRKQGKFQANQAQNGDFRRPPPIVRHEKPRYFAVLQYLANDAAGADRAMTWAAIIGGAFLALIIWGRIHGSRIKEQMANGSYARRFIYVNEDGTARELSPEEIEYLNTEFRGADGGRPYVKMRYRQRTSDGKISGYLPRRKLPRGTRVDAN